jgi:predicted N-acetyltransferase YhbS
VAPDLQRLGIGRDLVRTVTDEAFRAGCDWVHVDYEPEYVTFYERACGFRPTSAGLRSRVGGAAAASPQDPSRTHN